MKGAKFMKIYGRNILKASLILVLILSMTFSSFSIFSTRSLADSTILDGTQSKWAEEELIEAYSSGLTYPQIENSYQRPITREEFAVIVVKLYEKLGGVVPSLGINPFTDTTNPEIRKAHALGIVNGTSATTFTPYNNITRQEISVMIYQALKAFNKDLDKSLGDDFPFEDASSIAPWALESVRFVYKSGIMAGLSPSKIAPLENTNREQAIILLKRTLNKYSAEKKTPTEPAKDENTNTPGKDNGGTANYEDGIVSKVDMILDTNNLKLDGLVNIKAIDLLVNPLKKDSVGFPLKRKDANLAGVQYLGRGYNAVTGKYADSGPDSLTEFYIFDINKLLDDGYLHKLEGSSSESRFITGKGIDTYSKNLATSVGVSGGVPLFSGSAKVNFSSSSISESNRWFATLMYEIPQYGVYIDDLGTSYRNYLNKDFDFNKALNSGDPEKLFNKYGTHVLRSIRMGGRLEYSSSISSKYQASSSSFEADVKASFNTGFVNTSVQVAHSNKQASSSFREHNETIIRAYPAYGSYILQPNKFDEWFKYALKNPGISGFGKEPLVPIYTLASSSKRREELRKAYNKYVNEGKPIKSLGRK